MPIPTEHMRKRAQKLCSNAQRRLANRPDGARPDAAKAGFAGDRQDSRRKFPARFKTSDDALARAGDLSLRYSK
jgi:hypothetical protein